MHIGNHFSHYMVILVNEFKIDGVTMCFEYPLYIFDISINKGRLINP